MPSPPARPRSWLGSASRRPSSCRGRDEWHEPLRAQRASRGQVVADDETVYPQLMEQVSERPAELVPADADTAVVAAIVDVGARCKGRVRSACTSTPQMTAPPWSRRGRPHPRRVPHPDRGSRTCCIPTPRGSLSSRLRGLARSCACPSAGWERRRPAGPARPEALHARMGAPGRETPASRSWRRSARPRPQGDGARVPPPAALATPSVSPQPCRVAPRSRAGAGARVSRE